MTEACEILAASDPNATADVGVETQLAVEKFLYRQAEILDEKRLDEWLTLFADDGWYWMPAEAEQVEGDGQPNIFWEDQGLMMMRNARNTHPRAHSQAPHNRLCHVVSNVIVESESSSGDIIARSRFHCAEYLRYEVRNFTGRYRHLLKKTDGGYKIALQRVDLVNREGPYDYVLQWWL